jgi:hypothetical protein
MRKLIPLVAFLFAHVASDAQGQTSTRSAELPILLEVYADHFELQGKSFESRPDLASAIRSLPRPGRMAIHWLAAGGDEKLRVAVLSKVEEARLAAADAGLKSVAVVGNEVFGPTQTLAGPSQFDEERSLTSVEYQGVRIALARPYADFHDYKEDPNNLDENAKRSAELLMRKARFGPVLESSKALVAAVFELEFPGYGAFIANQDDSRNVGGLELAYVEIPGRRVNRYVALEKAADGSLHVVDDFIAPQEPEITAVRRGIGGALVYTHGREGQVVEPKRE